MTIRVHEITKDMLSYIITCRDRYPFFSDEMLQTWVEDRVRYAQQVINRLDEDERSMFNIGRQEVKQRRNEKV